MELSLYVMTSLIVERGLTTIYVTGFIHNTVQITISLDWKNFNTFLLDFIDVRKIVNLNKYSSS